MSDEENFDHPMYIAFQAWIDHLKSGDKTPDTRAKIMETVLPAIDELDDVGKIFLGLK